MEKVYKIPESVMAEILKIVNSLPYGQVAQLANTLGKLINEQSDETKLKDEG